MPKTTYVKITKSGKDPMQFLKEVDNKLHFELQNEIKLSADATAFIMKKILESSGYHLQELSNAINAEIIDSVGGINIGIGRISGFPKGKNGETYWEAFNDGFKPGASGTFVPLGSFAIFESPDSSKSGGKWIIGDGKSTFKDTNQNKNPVEPLRFVDIGYIDLTSHVNKEIEKFLRSLK